MKLKSNKGSISIFVIVALTFYMSFSMLMYAANLNKIQTITEKMDAVKAIYSRNYDNIDDVYNRKLAKENKMKPIINLPNKIITNVTKLGQYVEYGGTGEEKTEYSAFGETKTSMDELIKYIDDNKKYGMVSITVNAYGANGQISNETKEIEIIRVATINNEIDLIIVFASSYDTYIYINSDIKCTNTISMENVSHKIDLNGHTISCDKTNESYKFITMGNGTELTILDSSDNKSGAIITNMSEAVESDGINRTRQVHCISNNTGKLTIESGRIEVNIDQRMLKKNDGTSINDTSYVIENGGTLTLKGGTISSNTYAQGCTFMAVREAQARSVGVNNWGTFNIEGGTIISKAEANMIRGKNATLKGKTYAYAYGILNGGTVNNSDNAKFDMSAVANKYGTYYQDSETKEVTDKMKSM